MKVFAAGEVCADFRFSYAADALGRIVIANALFFGTDRASDLLVPRVSYTDPELASLGVPPEVVSKLHLKTMELHFDDLDRVLLDDDCDGLLKIHHDRRGTILGATLVASHASELIGEVAVAMKHGIRLGSLAADVHPYPTQAEIIKKAGDQFRSTLLTPSIAKFLKKLLEWRR